jgi:TolB-like protein
MGIGEMDENAICRLVLEGAVEREGRKVLSCARAFEIHRRHHVPLAEIGRICDENDIRIHACQLGCFP